MLHRLKEKPQNLKRDEEWVWQEILKLKAAMVKKTNVIEWQEKGLPQGRWGVEMRGKTRRRSNRYRLIEEGALTTHGHNSMGETNPQSPQSSSGATSTRLEWWHPASWRDASSKNCEDGCMCTDKFITKIKSRKNEKRMGLCVRTNKIRKKKLRKKDKWMGIWAQVLPK